MTNYRIWKTEYDKNILLIELFDKYSLLDTQKEFIDKGYIVLDTSFTDNDTAFILVEKQGDK